MKAALIFCAFVLSMYALGAAIDMPSETDLAATVALDLNDAQVSARQQMARVAEQQEQQ